LFFLYIQLTPKRGLINFMESGLEKKGAAMGRGERLAIRILLLNALLGSLFMAACAEVRLQTITAPPPTAKLRVFVKPITGDSGGLRSLDATHPQFEKGVIQMTERMLKGAGIYEVVRQEDLQSVLGGKNSFSRGDWSKKNWALARQVGKALHAEYAIIIERSRYKGILYSEMVLVNVETGKQFSALVRVPLKYRDDYRNMFRVSYRNIFREAKGDMLTTAFRKGRLIAPQSFGPKPAVPVETPLPVEKLPAPPTPETSIDLEQALTAEATTPGRTSLAIYDLTTSEPYKIVALILSEALREEVFHLGDFALVNRENIVQILNEIGLQQTGLVDESQAVRVGKGLAANQIMLGQYGVLGKTSILQAKRIDVATQGTLALESIKCTQGKEEEILAGLPEFARNLARK